MRILLDECLPKRLASLLLGHEVITVRQMNWLGLSNGRLLEVANPQFEMFLTVDIWMTDFGMATDVRPAPLPSPPSRLPGKPTIRDVCHCGTVGRAQSGRTWA